MDRGYLPEIAGYISRPRIDALIHKGLDYPLVLVFAGPGYGKTLAVAHYLKQADVRLIYHRLSRTRTTAADFWDDLVKATKRELPEYAKKLDDLGFPDSTGKFEQFREFAHKITQHGKRLVLVVDNYERIQDDAVTRFLNFLIDIDLPNHTIFLLCNVILPFVDVLPASGQLRITSETLAFTLDETKTMFEQYGIEAPADILERAVKVTGGWPLGLRLVCESCPGNPEEFSSHSPIRLVAELHDLHYFSNYPRDVQKQLVLFSMLPQFSLDMIHDETETSKNDFSRLLLSHPFISHDRADGLFTFQAMYHDFLRQKLSLLGREERCDMARRAGQWFLENSMIDEAMDCFWEAADYGGFMAAVYAMPKMRVSISQTNRVLQRLEQLPHSYATNEPGVDYAIAFMHLNAARMHRARELLLDVAERLNTQPDSPGKHEMLGDIYAALADIATYLNEDTGLTWIKMACEQAPNGNRIHSPELLAVGGNSVFFLPNGEAGQLEHMVEYFFEYAIYADRVKNGCGYGYEYLFAGEAALYRENMNHAAAMFNSAIMKARRTGQHDIILNGLWDLGRIEIYYGNHKNALALLGEIEAYVNDNHLAGLYELRDSFIFWFYWKLDDVSKIPPWFGDTMAGPEAMPVSMARKQLTGANYLYMIGERVKSYALVLQLETLLENAGQWDERFELYILKARHHMEAAEPALFEPAFRKAYSMVHANNLKFCLSRYGRDMMLMLDYLKRQGASGYDSEWLDEVYQDSASFAKRLHVMQVAYKSRSSTRLSGIALTKRENETLHFLAQGLTQKEIGKLMGISENAVKKHISKIYFKLGAINRADAIHIATVNGLVDVINN